MLSPASTHIWTTASRHRTEEGPATYQRCPCGAWRLLHDGAEIWRSSPKPCAHARETTDLAPTPRGWPHHKAWAASGLFRDEAEQRPR